MLHNVEIKLSPREAADPDVVRRESLRAAGLKSSDLLTPVRIQRRSIDARSSKPKVVMTVAVYQDETPPKELELWRSLREADKSRRVIIIGAGPAGYFAALQLLRYGIQPIILDRGKDVRSRRRDLRAIQQEGIVNPDSNYCFGEGGAGAYSDGKLYTRSSKRGNVQEVLRWLIEHGADPVIGIEAHPHIGSNKLPNVVAAMRHRIENYGGEIHFEQRVVDFIIDKKVAKGVRTLNGDEFMADAVVVATGHSARDIYALCDQRGVRTEFKAFAMGVRVEHPQELIDEIQYRQRPRDPFLSAASYRLATQVDGRGVYSFCMCPGGLIVPAATAPGETVVNGMSMSRRDSRYANSGIVVEIRREDLAAYARYGEQCGLEYQRALEAIAFNAGGDATQRVAAQGLIDFCNSKESSSLPSCSYIPGTHCASLHSILPSALSKRLQRAFKDFDQQMRGFYTKDALITGVESRTSTPLKLPRNNDDLQHPDCRGFFPCGEGAGYAGGIVSAAMDGQRVADAAAVYLGVKHF